MRLLIAVDDGALAGFLRKGLESEGYEIQVVANGCAALAALVASALDLAILDLNTPGSDGMQVLRQLRQSGATLPVLVLTGHNELDTRLACLDMGADDCMFKPFSLLELRARCRAMLRRAASAPNSTLQIGDLILHRLERVVERGGRRIALTPREYALLEQLMLERGRCIPRDLLMERAWSVGSSKANSVDVYINYLRTKLGDRGPMRLIETVRGQGYRIALPSPGSPLALHRLPSGSKPPALLPGLAATRA